MDNEKAVPLPPEIGPGGVIRRWPCGVHWPVLPTVYEDELSYLECVQKIYKAVQDTLKYMYQIVDEITKDTNDYTDQQIDILRAELLAKIRDVDEKHDKLHNDLVLAQGELNIRVNQLYADWVKYQAYLDSRMTAMMVSLKQYVDSLIVGRVVYVINPVTGQMDTLQNTLNMMWSQMNVGALTAAEYDSMLLTAAEYDAMRIPAIVYDTRGRFVPGIFERLYLRMRSPFTGKMDTYENVIYACIRLHQVALTAEEYDSKNLTAAEYDAKKITAYNYDWEGRLIIDD